MKNHIDVLTIIANTARDLKDRINEKIEKNDEVISVCMTDGRPLGSKTFLVVIARNVSIPTIKRVLKDGP